MSCEYKHNSHAFLKHTKKPTTIFTFSSQGLVYRFSRYAPGWIHPQVTEGNSSPLLSAHTVPGFSQKASCTHPAAYPILPRGVMHLQRVVEEIGCNLAGGTAPSATADQQQRSTNIPCISSFALISLMREAMCVQRMFFAARYRRWHLANTTQDAAFLRQHQQGPENPCSIQRMSCCTEQMDPSKHRRAPMLWHKEKCRQYFLLFFCLLELERLWLSYYRLLYQSIQSGASPFQQNALNSWGEQLERNPGRGRDSKPICAQLW